MKISLKYCIIICIILIVLALFIAYNLRSKKSTKSSSSSLQPVKNENYMYPYYPYTYQATDEYIYKNDPNIRLMGSGDLLVWNTDPIHPLLIKCRNDKFQSELCKYIIDGRKITPTTP